MPHAPPEGRPRGISVIRSPRGRREGTANPCLTPVCASTPHATREPPRTGRSGVPAARSGVPAAPPRALSPDQPFARSSRRRALSPDRPFARSSQRRSTPPPNCGGGVFRFLKACVCEQPLPQGCRRDRREPRGTSGEAGGGEGAAETAPSGEATRRVRLVLCRAHRRRGDHPRGRRLRGEKRWLRLRGQWGGSWHSCAGWECLP
jgi:hypothetical protein